jgi:hypothetical protein
MKWQYVILAAILIGAVALSLWTAGHIDMNDIQRRLTNSSGNEREGLIEGGNIPLYLGIVVTLLVIGVGSSVYISKRR